MQEAQNKMHEYQNTPKALQKSLDFEIENYPQSQSITEITKKYKNIDINSISPMESMGLLFELQEQLKKWQ